MSSDYCVNAVLLSQVMLGQGTLRPDLIESASSLATVGGAEASCIKTHHNDTNLVRELRAAGKVRTATARVQFWMSKTAPRSG